MLRNGFDLLREVGDLRRHVLLVLLVGPNTLPDRFQLGFQFNILQIGGAGLASPFLRQSCNRFFRFLDLPLDLDHIRMARLVTRFEFSLGYSQFVQLGFGGCFLVYVLSIKNAFGFEILDLLLDGRPPCLFVGNLGRPVLVLKLELVGDSEVVVNMLGKRVSNLRFVIFEFLALLFEALFQFFDLGSDNGLGLFIGLFVLHRRLFNEKFRQLVGDIHRFVTVGTLVGQLEGALAVQLDIDIVLESVQSPSGQIPSRRLACFRQFGRFLQDSGTEQHFTQRPQMILHIGCGRNDMFQIVRRSGLFCSQASCRPVTAGLRVRIQTEPQGQEQSGHDHISLPSAQCLKQFENRYRISGASSCH